MIKEIIKSLLYLPIRILITILNIIKNFFTTTLNLTKRAISLTKKTIKKASNLLITLTKKATTLTFSLIHTIIFLSGLTLILTSFPIIKIYKILKNLITKHKISSLYKKLEKSKNFKEYQKIAKIIDIYNNRLPWQKIVESSEYNYKYLSEIIKNLDNFLKTENAEKCSNFLRSIFHKDSCGLKNPNLYTYCLSGTKDVIINKNKKILKCLEMIYKSEMDLDRKKRVFKELKHIYGKSGIVFSGGGGLGMIHLGVLSVLMDEGFLPNVVCGASVGSLIAGLIGTNSRERLEEMNRNFFGDLDFSAFDGIPGRGNFFRKFFRFFRSGVLLDRYPLKQFFMVNSHNLTFYEAYKKTGIKINITVTDSVYEKFKVLNYITAPNVFVWSALLASCSFPCLMTPTKIIKKTKTGKKQWIPISKTFTDGTIGADIPKKTISSLFNIKNFIVSQVNPFVVPFLKKTRKKNSLIFVFYKIWDSLVQFVFSEFRHRIEQMDQLFLVPKKFVLFYNLLLQKYTGDVNVVPELGFWDYFGVLDNPNKEGFRKGVLKGRGVGFGVLGQVRGFMEVEKVLKYYDLQLRKIV